MDAVDRKAKVNIEIKGQNTAQPVSDLIREYIDKNNWSYEDSWSDNNSGRSSYYGY